MSGSASQIMLLPFNRHCIGPGPTVELAADDFLPLLTELLMEFINIVFLLFFVF
jgi:hypothetical protein